ncbi:MAG: hypothetical protein U0R44_04155 [Candidatus Micrarchaeia archaeon]
MEIVWNILEIATGAPDLVAIPLWLAKIAIFIGSAYYAMENRLGMVKSAVAVGLGYSLVNFPEGFLLSPLFYPGTIFYRAAFTVGIPDILFGFVKDFFVGAVFGVIGGYLSPVISSAIQDRVITGKASTASRNPRNTA